MRLLNASCTGLLCWLVAFSTAYSATAEPAGAEVEFNPAFLQGGSRIDVSRFSRGNAVLPGEYLLDVQVNGKWLDRTSVRFVGQPNSDVARPCINRALFSQIGVDPENLSVRAGLQQAGVEGCLDLPTMIPDTAVSFDLSRLQLDISVPQAAMLRMPRGQVAPEFWDSGVPSATLGYNFNAYRSEASGTSTTRAHVGLIAGANYGSWHLRQRSSIQVDSDGSSTYQGVATYLEHDMPSLRSDLLVGDSFTDGAVFESFGFRGVSMSSSDEMLPDSQLEFAPVVRGIARTNARVVIVQNGITILETTVSPGAFEINDLYATGYGGDLNVEIHEADGDLQRFAVPYASMVQLLRPGVWRYTATAGELRQPDFTDTEPFAQATIQHGFDSHVTGYAGALGAQNYQSTLLGIALNTAAGGIAADVTGSRTNLAGNSYVIGQSVRIGYNRFFHDIGTNIAVAAYRFSSSGYYSFADAQSIRQAIGGFPDASGLRRARDQWQVSLNQNLPQQWGNLFLTASARDYWHAPGTTTQLQGGYNSHVQIGSVRFSYGVSIARQTSALTGKPDNRLQANFSLPLGHGAHSPMFSAGFTQTNIDGISTRDGQEVITGTAGENSQLSYSVSASQAAGNAAYSASAQYRGAYSSTSASVGVGSGYSQQSLGATGGMVLHRGGITLANQMTDTFGIVEAEGAEGARVTNNIGSVVNHSGYAVLPFLLPYRMNSVTLDPEGAVSADIEFKSTTQMIAPRRNAVVLVRFETVGGRAILITARLPDGSEVPFGANVYDEQGSDVGLTGQDGRIYLRGIAESGTLTARWGDAPDQQCAFKYQLPAKQKNDEAFVRLDTSCIAYE
ncbi:MAG: fimbria/pilus outer membrane usher protein [Pseudomonadota bacterium]